MSSSESGCDSFPSSSENSDYERSEKRGLLIPNPVLLSDAEDNGVNPSQHKLAKEKQMAVRDLIDMG
jgi:hypothetical protein